MTCICLYCNFNCFVPVPKDAPEEVKSKVQEFLTEIPMLYTCQQGMADDKYTLGTNYAEIMAAIVHKENLNSLDRLLKYTRSLEEKLNQSYLRNSLNLR